MNTGPYSDEEVQRFLEDEFVPLKNQCFWDKRTDLMKRFGIKWTPTFIILDSEGREHERFVGFVPTEDFLAHLVLAKGKIFFNHDKYAEAISQFKALIERYPDTGPAPEAVFLRGVPSTGRPTIPGRCAGPTTRS